MPPTRAPSRSRTLVRVEQRFSSLADVERWLDRVESATSVTAADAAGFSPGQALVHCAQSLDYQRTGFPAPKPTIVRRTVGRVVAAAFLRRGSMRHAIDAPIPGAPMIDTTGTAPGVAAVRRAIADFRAADTVAEHFVYGRLDHAQAERLQAFHIANHAAAITLG